MKHGLGRDIAGVRHFARLALIESRHVPHSIGHALKFRSAILSADHRHRNMSGCPTHIPFLARFRYNYRRRHTNDGMRMWFHAP